jgi:hypothetical protein
MIQNFSQSMRAGRIRQTIEAWTKTQPGLSSRKTIETTALAQKARKVKTNRCNSMRSILMAVSLVLLASTAHANDCDVKASRIVKTIGGTVESHDGSIIYLQHDAVPVPGSFQLDCIEGDDQAQLLMGWRSGRIPSRDFWSVAGSAGAIVTGSSPGAIEAGARVCFDTAQLSGDGKGGYGPANDFTQDGVRFNCSVTDHSFIIFVSVKH